MKKILLALGMATMLAMPVAFAEDVTIPNSFTKVGGYAQLHSTDTDGFYSFYSGRYGIHTYVPGYCMDKVKLPANGDGAVFSNEDETVKLAIYGRHQFETFEEDYDNAINSFGSGITYKAVGGDWFVISGVRDGEIVYKKTFVRYGIATTMVFTFPYDEKDTYAWVVAILEEHFYPDRNGYDVG